MLDEKIEDRREEITMNANRIVGDLTSQLPGAAANQRDGTGTPSAAGTLPRSRVTASAREPSGTRHPLSRRHARRIRAIAALALTFADGAALLIVHLMGIH
jgi:hypothetical protein